MLSGSEYFICCQFGCVIEIDWVCGFVCGQFIDMMNFMLDCSVNNIFGFDYIGFDVFEWVVFGDWYVFQCGCMDDDIDVMYGYVEVVFIFYIVNEVMQEWIVIG